MSPKRYPSGHVSGDLPLHTLDFLLQQSRSPEETEALQRAGVNYDAFIVFSLDRMPVLEFQALWRRHELAIVAEAHRRGRPVPNPASYRPDGSWVRYEASV